MLTSDEMIEYYAELAGAPARGERLARCNRLMAIEAALGDAARFGFRDRDGEARKSTHAAAAFQRPYRARAVLPTRHGPWPHAESGVPTARLAPLRRHRSGLRTVPLNGGSVA